MDKIKFTMLVQWCITCLRQKDYFEGNELAKLDQMLVNMAQPAPPTKASETDVNELLRCMVTATEDGFIPAIKAYRVLTGAGLKESKDAIKKYRRTFGVVGD